MYGNFGPTISNVLVGIISAVVDNIPVMYAVLKMDPAMGLDQWLLITLTAGTGGSLLSVGSAAGVAVMGVDREKLHFYVAFKVGTRYRRWIHRQYWIVVSGHDGPAVKYPARARVKTKTAFAPALFNIFDASLTVAPVVNISSTKSIFFPCT